MKNILFSGFFVLVALLQYSVMHASEITLDECLDAAIRKNKQQNNAKLIDNKNDLERYNLNSLYFPQLSLDASATVQSDVMSLPIKLPNFSMNEIPKENYQVSAQIQQLIWDGGNISAAIGIKELQNILEKNSIEITTQTLKENISRLFFSALLLQQNSVILQENIEFLQSRENQLQSMYKNGVIIKSNLLSLQIEIEKIKMKLSATQSDLKSIKETLANYLEMPEFTNGNLVSPNQDIFNSVIELKRAELKSLDYKNELLESTKESAASNLMPKIAAFAKVGYGNPNPMNIFEEGFQTYYMAGINLKWQPFDWYKSTKTKEVITLNQEINNNDKYELKRSLNNIIISEKQNIQKYMALLTTDDSVIEMQERVVDMAFSQLQNGTITSTQYILEIKNLTDAKINRSVHYIQKQLAISNLLIQTGNK